MAQVLAFGTFDLLHKGHLYFLKKAKSYGDKLFVVVARDSTVKKVKGFLPNENENLRLMNVMSTNFADEVLLGGDGNPYDILKQVMPDIICLGYDQKAFIDSLESELKKIGLEKTKIIRIEPFKPDVYKSSKIREHKK